MNKFKPDLTKQSLIFGYNVNDFINEIHLVRVIDEIVERLDITKIENKYSYKGQKSYPPKTMIKLLFYGYSIGVFSSRKIERACKKDLEFMYITKLYRPDFRTISDFRKNHLEEITEYFVDILKYCNELGMLNVGNIAIDGSKFRANASSERTKTKEGYAKWENRLKNEINDLTEKAENIDIEENNRLKDKEVNQNIPKEIKKRETLIKKIIEAKNSLEEIKKTSPKKEPKINLTDKDATFQKERIGVIRTNYNAQIATTSEQLIVAADVIKEAGDRKHLIPMIEKVEENTEQKVEEVKADSGYSSYENYEEIEKRKIDAYIPDQNHHIINKKKNKQTLEPYHKENFKYNSENDTYTCPEGKKLENKKKRNNKYLIYRCNSCVACNKKEECTSTKSRSINRHNSENLQEAMRKKLETHEGKRKYIERMHMVETPFGHFKKNINFRQFLLRGLGKVKGEFRLLCIGFNIRKIYGWKLANV